MARRPEKPRDRVANPRFKKQRQRGLAMTKPGPIALSSHIRGQVLEVKPGVEKPPSPIVQADLMIDTVPSLFPEFYAAIGRAMAAWQHIEDLLGEIFSKVSTCRGEEVAAAIYYGNQEFSVRISVTHYAARISLSDAALFEAWGEIRKELIDASERRNALAHFHTVLQMPIGASFKTVLRKISETGSLMGSAESGPTIEGLKLMLKPTLTNPNEGFKSNQKKTKKPMNVQDIIRARIAFGTLHEKMKKFVEKIPQLPVPKE